MLPVILRVTAKPPFMSNDKLTFLRGKLPFYDFMKECHILKNAIADFGENVRLQKNLVQQLKVCFYSLDFLHDLGG